MKNLTIAERKFCDAAGKRLFHLIQVRDGVWWGYCCELYAAFPTCIPTCIIPFFFDYLYFRGLCSTPKPLRGHSGDILGVLPLLQQACGAEDKVPGVPMAFQHVADSNVAALEGQASFKAMNSMSMQSLVVNQLQ